VELAAAVEFNPTQALNDNSAITECCLQHFGRVQNGLPSGHIEDGVFRTALSTCSGELQGVHANHLHIRQDTGDLGLNAFEHKERFGRDVHLQHPVASQ
jgi:hypothetical protein